LGIADSKGEVTVAFARRKRTTTAEAKSVSDTRFGGNSGAIEIAIDDVAVDSQ